jgi:hypothetical protein
MRRRENGGQRSSVPKTPVLWVYLICLLGSTNVGWAASKWFYEDGKIQEGEVYSYVGTFNNATVDMTGGDITDQLTARNTSTVNISGGFAYALVGTEESRINLLGTGEVYRLQIDTSSVFNMYGGTVDVMRIGTLGGAYLYNGAIYDYLLANSTVDIYGYGFAYDAGSGAHRGGQLTGFWGNRTPFSIDLYAQYGVPGAGDIDTWSHIALHEIPEPGTLVLLAIGMLMRPRRISAIQK